MYSSKFVESHHYSPLFYLARSEGRLLRCDKQYDFRKPRPFDFGRARCEASRSFTTLFELGEHFLDDAGSRFVTNDLRPAAFLTAQAAVLFYQALFYTYHGFGAAAGDLELLHDRLRTLSAELMLLFDPSHHSAVNTIPRLNHLFDDARYNLRFDATGREIEEHLDRVERMKTIVESLCRSRLALYAERTGK